MDLELNPDSNAAVEPDRNLTAFSSATITHLSTLGQQPTFYLVVWISVSAALDRVQT
jgi:hypothetical protein